MSCFDTKFSMQARTKSIQFPNLSNYSPSCAEKYALGELSHSPLREWHLAISYSWAYHFIFTSFLYFQCRCFPSGMGDAHTSTVSAHTSLSSRRANYRSSAHGREQTSFIPRLLPGSSSNICFTFSDIGGEKIMYIRKRKECPTHSYQHQRIDMPKRVGQLFKPAQ